MKKEVVSKRTITTKKVNEIYRFGTDEPGMRVLIDLVNGSISLFGGITSEVVIIDQEELDTAIELLQRARMFINYGPHNAT